MLKNSFPSVGRFTTSLKNLSLAILAGGAVSLHGQELIVNGDFSDGLTGWTIETPAGWAYPFAPVLPGYGGKMAFNAGDVAPVGKASQTFATVPGVSYTLTFDYSTFYGNWYVPAQILQVDVSNSDLDTQYVLSQSNDGTSSDGPVTNFSFTFVANSTSSTLTFSDYASNNTYSEDALVDNVSVVANGPAADITPPTIRSVTPSVATLWPANHKMVAVSLSVVAFDDVGVESIRIVSVSSSEPDDGLGDGDTAGDVQYGRGLTVNLRAERSGTGSGRTYEIVVEVQDAAGNSSRGSTSVFVPKSLAH